jgi:hypothetical protein
MAVHLQLRYSCTKYCGADKGFESRFLKIFTLKRHLKNTHNLSLQNIEALTCTMEGVGRQAMWEDCELTEFIRLKNKVCSFLDRGL